ncbi:MAG: hypothetical protein LBF86_03750 [Helicobacteraceae bacterium]|jgi:hypothetical protein|nr:hypothetical protein [Helicobacteraceae bacterium]
MTAATLMDDAELIASRANASIVITNSRAAFTRGLKELAIPPAEKAKLIAQFEQAFGLGILEKAISAAMDIELKNAQVQASLAQAANARAHAEGFENNLRVQAATVYANYAALAANNNIMTNAIANNMKELCKSIVNKDHIINWQ